MRTIPLKMLIVSTGAMETTEHKRKLKTTENNRTIPLKRPFLFTGAMKTTDRYLCVFSRVARTVCVLAGENAQHRGRIIGT